ncbi:uncharacterized protein LOC100209721 isoform X2 [Hydra vulgaris]
MHSRAAHMVSLALIKCKKVQRSLATDTTIADPNLAADIQTERFTLAAESPIVADNSPVVAVESPIVTTESPIVTTESPIVTTESPIVTDQRPRKRKRCVTNWKKNVIKRLRNTGSEYVKHGGTLQKPKKLNKHYLINHSCKNKCAENLTLEQTKTLFENFWKLGDLDAQNLFLAGCVKQSTVECRRPRVRKNKITKNEKKRAKDFARVYSVFADNKPVTVCKPYFLAIFDISSGRLNRALVNQRENGSVSGKDGRGKYDHKTQRIHEEQITRIKDHIRMFPTYVTILEVAVHLAAFYLLI